MSSFREYHVFKNSLLMGQSFSQIGVSPIVGNVGPTGSLTVVPRNDPHWSQVELYIPMTGANNGTTFTDLAKGRTVTCSAPLITQVGTGPQGETSYGYYTSASDILARQLEIPHSPDLNLTNKDFCAEWFHRPTTQVASKASPIFFSKRGGSGSQLEIEFDIWNSLLCLYVSSNGTTWTELISDLTWARTYGQWYHMRLSRSGSAWRLWIDGVKVWQGTWSGTLFSGSQPFGIMGTGVNAQQGTWSMCHFRLTVGHSRETTDTISVPTLPFPIS